MKPVGLFAFILSFSVKLALHAQTAGTLDAGFDPYVNSTVFTTSAQADGKIIIGGGFIAVDGASRNYIARLTPGGKLDAGFNPNASGTVNCTAVQTDGKIVLAGAFTNVGGVERTRIARVNSDGTLDAGFSPPDIGGSSGYVTVQCAVLQADGKIVIAGNFDLVNGVARRYIARLNSDGSLDAGFNPVIDGGAFFTSVYSTVVQSDGDIIIAGGFSSVNGVPRNSIARVHVDGTLVMGFDPGPIVETARSPYFPRYFCAAAQPDGKIVVGGQFTSIGGVARNCIARLNADGTLDAGFDPVANNFVFNVAVQTDGRMILGGFFTTLAGATRNRIARVNGDGTLDAIFNPNANNEVYSTSVQAAGKIVIGGAFTRMSGVSHNCIAQVNNETGTQNLSAPDSTRVEWLRGGVGPEVSQVTFDLSTNGGMTWSALGVGTRIDGGWRLAGLSLPVSGSIRARGRTAGGLQNGSSGLVEAITTFPTTPIQPWKLSHLGDNTAPDLADPDRDGLSTLAEYGLNLLPEMPSQPPGASAFTYAGGNRMRMLVPRDPAHHDITVSVEATGDLASGPWTALATSTLGAPFAGPGYVGGDDATPGVKMVEVRDIVNLSTTTQRWLRVKVTH